MDAFVTRRKRKSSPEVVNEESTDLKLAILSSLHPDFDHETLLDILLAHDGNVEATSQALKATRLPQRRKSNSGSVVAAQSSLRSFAVNSENAESSPSTKRAKTLTRKGATLHLYDPRDISEHTPCTIIHNFLPADEADSLLRELLEEAKSFEKITFKLFDNVVSSPHTSGLYVGDYDEMQEQKHEYVYNGSRMTDVRTLTPQLERVKARVQKAVNEEIQERIRTRYGGKKLKYQSPGPWTPNAAFVNCYNGPQENVGWHSDQLTYLGPRAVIGSLSLGVTREFRVRRIPVPPPEGPDGDELHKTKPPNDHDRDHGSQPGGLLGSSSADGAETGPISIHLPHNSLLVMHADMQEEWKHSVAPAPAVDAHPVSGVRRINVTYRHYRAGFHPRATPRCPCGVPAVLRVVTRKRETWGRYFWMCYAGNVPGREACAFFRWAEFDEDGNPLELGGSSGRKKEQQQEEDNKESVGVGVEEETA